MAFRGDSAGIEWWISAPMAGAALLLCLGCQRARPAPAAARAAASASREEHEVPVARTRPGASRTYDFELSSKATLGTGVLTQFGVRGRCNVVAVDVSEERAVYRAKIAGAAFHSEIREKSAEFQALAPGLGTPFAVELAANGGLSHVYLEPGLNGLVAGIQQSLAAALQASRGQAGARAWKATEFDATGRYDAAYEISPDGSLRRHKTAYDGVATNAAGGSPEQTLLPSVLASEASIVLGAEALPDSVHDREATSVKVARSQPIESATDLAFRVSSTGHVDAATIPDLQTLLTPENRHDPERPWVPKPNRDAIDDERIGGRSLEEILRGVQRVLAEPAAQTDDDRKAASRRRADAFGALAAFVRRREGTVAKLVQRVERKDALSAALLDALGEAGSDDAQQALSTLLGRNVLDPVPAKAAAIALSRTTHPSTAAVATLRALVDDPALGTQAMYGIGTAARHLREGGEAARSADIARFLIERLRASQNTLPRVTALRAIANSGSDAAYPVVEPMLTSKEDLVREAAVESLQLMTLPSVDTVLATHVTSDPSASVRMAALRAARLRTPSPALETATVSTVRSDRDAHVRLDALRAITAWLPRRPSLRDVIQRVSVEDAEEPIRREAHTALLDGST